MLQRNIRVSLFFASIIIGFGTYVKGSFGQNGGYAGAYLRYGTGVRPLSLGGAFVAVANDVTAGYWNPAGLARLQETQFMGMYSLLSLNRMYNYAAVAHPIGSHGTLGFSWINFHVGEIEGRDRAGQVTEPFSNSENALIFSYAKSIERILFLGGSVKYLFHSLAGSTAHGWGLDAGVQLKPIDLLSFGVSIQDIETKIGWNSPSQPTFKFPTTTRAGIAITPKDIPLLFSFDYEKTKTQEGRFHGGVEAFLIKQFGFRVGINHGKFTFGSCITVPFTKTELQMDYGFFASSGFEPTPVHRVSLLLKLLKPPPKVTQTNLNGQAISPSEHNQNSNHFNNGNKLSPRNSRPSVLMARVTKVNSEYIYINIGTVHSLTTGSQYDLYLPLKLNGGADGAKSLGRFEVFKASKNMSVIKVIFRKDAYELQLGDAVGLKPVETTHKQ